MINMINIKLIYLLTMRKFAAVCTAVKVTSSISNVLMIIIWLTQKAIIQSVLCLRRTRLPGRNSLLSFAMKKRLSQTQEIHHIYHLKNFIQIFNAISITCFIYSAIIVLLLSQS